LILFRSANVYADAADRKRLAGRAMGLLDQNENADCCPICFRPAMTRSPQRTPAPNRRPYRSYYDDDLKKRVAALYAEDVESFGYSFWLGGRTSPYGAPTDVALQRR
jgi:hypothetical protein